MRFNSLLPGRMSHRFKALLKKHRKRQEHPAHYVGGLRCWSETYRPHRVIQVWQAEAQCRMRCSCGVEIVAPSRMELMHHYTAHALDGGE